MRQATLPPQEAPAQEVKLYQKAGRLIAVKPAVEERPSVTKELESNKVFLGTVTTDSGKLTVADPYAFGATDDEVTLTPGLGAGTYDVHAIFQEVPSYGLRITKLEIDFIPDWELNERHKLDAKGD